MNSNNITMHKFGIENNYISMAMNTMLGKTNNTVKSMNVSETNAVIVDLSYWYIISIIGVVISIVGIIAAVALLNTNPVGWVLDVEILGIAAAITSIIAFVGMSHSCWNINQNPWW